MKRFIIGLFLIFFAVSGCAEKKVQTAQHVLSTPGYFVDIPNGWVSLPRIRIAQSRFRPFISSPNVLCDGGVTKAPDSDLLLPTIAFGRRELGKLSVSDIPKMNASIGQSFFREYAKYGQRASINSTAYDESRKYFVLDGTVIFSARRSFDFLLARYYTNKGDLIFVAVVFSEDKKTKEEMRTILSNITIEPNLLYRD